MRPSGVSSGGHGLLRHQWGHQRGGGGGEEAAEDQQGDRAADPKGQTGLPRHAPPPPSRGWRVRQVHPGETDAYPPRGDPVLRGGKETEGGGDQEERPRVHRHHLDSHAQHRSSSKVCGPSARGATKLDPRIQHKGRL